MLFRSGGAGGSGVPGGTTPGGTPTSSNVVTYITKSGNTITDVSTIPASSSNVVTFGYYSIYKS